ncbi:MAG: type II secretion system F family protein [Propionibacteriaceae bacterium]|jgi:Flp pilus assembly protein TadB|nr:type II secretion system F family protein [Propionibacteriaceae bacterium]
MSVILALIGGLIAAGILLVIQGARSVHRRRINLKWPRFNWRSPIAIAVLLAGVGLVVTVLTGWTVAIVILPMIGLGLPYLIGTTETASDIAKMEAMEEWTRSLAGILTAGAGLEQALIASLNSTPGPLKPHVTRLVIRLKARWTTPSALRAFADDLDDPTGDIIAANLLLGAQRRGDGLATILEDLAESVALDIRARRHVEADAAKPRATARWVTIITGVVLLALFFTGDYVAPYKTGVGQVILLAMLAAYAGVLVWMKKIASGQPSLRFLGEHAAQEAS